MVEVSNIVYTSEARIDLMGGPVRHGYLGNISEPVVFGMQGTLRDWYKVGPDEPDAASTLDYIVAAVGACMAGTLRRAFLAREIPVDNDTIKTRVTGTVEKIGNGIKITAIHVDYKLRIPKDKREEAERSVAVHDKGCPASQSVGAAIAIDWDAEYEEA
jgi:uncharacterized OsmC-like protein